jgi:DNA modification methylase
MKELIAERMTTTTDEAGDSPLVFSTEHVKLYQGDSRLILHEQLAAESIHMCMCSPHYYGLRDYGLQPILWDGRAGCNHEFQTRHYKLHAGRGDAQKSGKYSEQEAIPDREMSDEMCIKCGAWKGQLGQEPKIGLYIRHLLQIFDEVHRVLRPDGTLWVNLGDSYSNGGEIPEKSLSMIPERFAISMIERGWILRNKIVWHKPNAMPQSAKDKFTPDWEPIFFFAKRQKSFFITQYEAYQTTPSELARYQKSDYNYNGQSLKDYDSAGAQTPRDIKQRTIESMRRSARFGGDKFVGFGSRLYSGKSWDPDTEIAGRIKRCVWPIPTRGYAGNHYAAYPPELCEVPIKAGCPESGGTVLDPFAGSGATGVAALKLGRSFVGIEISPEFCRQAIERLKQAAADHRLDSFF